MIMIIWLAVLLLESNSYLHIDALQIFSDDDDDDDDDHPAV